MNIPFKIFKFSFPSEINNCLGVCGGGNRDIVNLSFKEKNRKEPKINAWNCIITELFIIRMLSNLTIEGTEIQKDSVTYSRIHNVFIQKLGAIFLYTRLFHPRKFLVSTLNENTQNVSIKYSSS